MDKDDAAFHISEILKYQEKREINSFGHIVITAGKGYLSVIENKE